MARRMYSENQLNNKAVSAVQSGLNNGSVWTYLKNEHDEAGNQRFIEGDITLNDGINLTLDYGKWSLCGTHLMIVLAGSMADEAVHSSSTIATINLPAWIKNKIRVLHSTSVVDGQTVYFYGGTTQNSISYLEKYSNNITIYLNSITANADKTWRIQYDLLIDTAA